MLKQLVSAFVLVLALVQGAAAIDCASTVCGIPWGTTPSQVSGFTKTGDTAMLEFYSAPLNLELVPGVHAREAVFVFGELGLYAVFFHPETTDGYNQAMDEIMEQYGNPALKTDGEIKTYRWQNGDVIIKAWRHMGTGERKLAFYNSAMEPPRRAGFYEQHADSRSGFFPSAKQKRPESTSVIKF